MGSFTPSLRLSEPTPFDPAVKNSWGPILNTNDTLLEAAITGTASIAIGGLTSYSLTTANGAVDQARNAVYSFTGALTANCTVTLPTVPKIGWAANNTTGGFNVILTTGSGTTLILKPGGSWYLFNCDGTNVTGPTLGITSLTIDGVLNAGGTATNPCLSSVDQISLAGGSGSGGFINVNNNNHGSPLSVGVSGGGTQNVQWFHNGSVVGSVTTAASSTSYNTTSDYRLKKIEGRSDGRLIDEIAVYEGMWRLNPRQGVQPMILAHELQEHAPWAVTGEKDAVWEDGKIKPQQADFSKLIPALIAYVQKLRDRIATLEAQCRPANS